MEEETESRDEERSLHFVSSAADLKEKATIDESVQEFLLNSLVTQPLVISNNV